MLDDLSAPTEDLHAQLLECQEALRQEKWMRIAVEALLVALLLAFHVAWSFC